MPRFHQPMTLQLACLGSGQNILLQLSSMNSQEESEVEVEKILEKLFIYADNKDLNINRIRNLIVNPEILRVLIHQIGSLSPHEKMKLVGLVANIFNKNSLNPCILLKRDKQIREFNHSIFDEIVTFLFNIKVQFQQNYTLFAQVKPLIAGYPITCRNIKNIISKVARNFHDESFNVQKLHLSLLLLKELFRSQVPSVHEPSCYFCMYGPNSGVRLISQDVKWTLAKGMFVYLNFCLESLKHEEMNLLNITVNDDSFEVSVDEDNYLTIKVFSVSKIARTRKIQPRKWHFLKLAYSLRTGIIRNSYQMVAYIDGEPFELRDLPIPSPTIKDNIEELILGHEFYGKINLAVISRNQIKHWPKNGLNNWGQIEGLLAANKQHVKQIFLLYSPLLTSRTNENEIIFEITSKHHGQILDNTAVFNNSFNEVDINYYGGLYTLIPFFYILRFYNYQQFPNALEEMIGLVLTLFENKYRNVEIEAINCQMFGILAEFVNKVDEHYITPEFIDKVGLFKDYISNKDLRKQYLQSFLLKIRIRRLSNLKVIEKIHRLIAYFYFNDFSWALEVASMYDIIWYMVDNFEPALKEECCLLHAWQQSEQALDDAKIGLIDEHYKLKSHELRELIRFVVKQLCGSRRYDLLIPRGQAPEQEPLHGTEEAKRKQKFSIFEYLKYKDYSVCLKKILLECIQVGIQEDPQTLIKQTQLLECMYSLLGQVELRDQVTPIISVLCECSKVLSLTKDPKNLDIIRNIGWQMDRMYMKKYAAIRLRSRSEGIFLQKTPSISERKMSNELEDRICNGISTANQYIREKEREIKKKIIKLKSERKLKISNDKELYDLIICICCSRELESGDLILTDDDNTKIINPYFKICCTRFKMKLIDIIRTTVLVRSKLENVPPNMESLCKFDQIYRFVLSEFILKELDPDDPTYKPSEESNYIIKNFFYIIDHMVITMKNNWDKLYLFLLRMIGLLTEAKKDIHKKTERNKEEISLASKVCVRKFVLRILRHTQKSIENMSNMVFLVYLVVFNNPEKMVQDTHIFDYFRSLEANLFVGPIIINSPDDHEIIFKNLFIDQKIILTYFDNFKLDEVFHKDDSDPIKHRRYTLNFIKAYFELEQHNELQDYLYKLRKVFLSKTKFKEISNEDSQIIRSIISNFIIGNDDKKTKDSAETKELYVSDLIGLLLSLTVESALTCHRFQVLKQCLQKYSLFIQAFALSCSRDCLRKKQHSLRNESMPSRTVYHCIHFLYEMMENASIEEQRQLIEQAIYRTLNFITLVLSVLSEKVGNPDTVEDILMLSSVMQDVEQYNFFCFKVLEGVITLGEIRMYSTLHKQKCTEVLNHANMKKHFKQPPHVFLEKHIKEAVQIHKLNIDKVERELEQKFYESESTTSTKSNITLNYGVESEFEKYRLDHARKLDFEYRHMMKVWRKIWKRLRLYHYYWSVSMDQRQAMQHEWQKHKTLPYQYKFGKYTDLDGTRPILEVEPNEPWHVRKAQLDEQVKYRSENYMVNLYKPKAEHSTRPKSFINKLLWKSSGYGYFMVQWIKHNSKRKGRLTINSEKLIFRYESTFQKDSHKDFTSFTLAEHRPMEKAWALVGIVGIFRRRYLMKRQCLLIEFEDSSTLIFDFLDSDSAEFLKKIQQIQAEKNQLYPLIKANKIQFYLKKFNKANCQAEVEEATQSWLTGRITNFHYLLKLNKYSGRSYLDPVNYPVMPWIIANYDYQYLIYRDLSKTLGALGSASRRESYETKCDTGDPFSNVPPYQYGTHYSSPGVVFNFLIRINPYTQAARTLQGEKFDLSDRLFSSIKVCWHSVTNEMSDVRELNPEFYYLPEFLINIQNYDFGLTQLHERVDNVKLPAWANNAYDFICKHRRALEGDEVSQAINNWIDLIFGYRQKGKLAKESVNLYYYLTYEDSIDLEKIDDPVARTSIEAQIIHFGQTPSQLFTRPHPQRKFSKSAFSAASPEKIKFLGLIESSSPTILLHEPELNTLLVFNDSNLLSISLAPSFETRSQVSLLRGNSKDKLYFIEDIDASNKIVVFGGGRFVALGGYVNGDLLVYTAAGKKVEHKRGPRKNVVYVNKKQNLLLCGCENGLLEVYEIVYTDRDTVSLVKIISQYYMLPIEHISEGAEFYSICSGNLIVVNKITRSMSYIHDKQKMQGSKMLRSFESKRKVHGSFICTNPLYCLVFFNLLEIYVYSVNGQFLKSRQVESLVKPILMVDYMQRENVLALESNALLVLKLPELETVFSLPVPSKQYTDIKIIKDRLYLVTVNGEILYLFNQKQVAFY